MGWERECNKLRELELGQCEDPVGVSVFRDHSLEEYLLV
jgi:hypothetical protein